jgi:anti-sigma-K factor RskA
MSGADNTRMPDGGDDLIAAEYVLGVLDADGRRSVEERLEEDRSFARLVEAWQFRLSPLDEDYEPVAPPQAVKAALDKRLFTSTAAAKPGLLESLGFWRGLSFAALALAAVAIIPDLLRRDPQVAEVNPIIASMQAEGGEVRFVALYEPGDDEIRITTVKAEKATDRDFELWLIEADGKPKSMGVIPAGQTLALKVKPELVALISAGDTFAVTDEPLGGSPTGNPTGPIVAAGASLSI